MPSSISKIIAAKQASIYNTHTIIANANNVNILDKIFAKERVGTLFNLNNLENVKSVKTCEVIENE